MQRPLQKAATGKLCVTLLALEHQKGKVPFWKGEFGCIMSGLSLYRIAGFMGLERRKILSRKIRRRNVHLRYFSKGGKMGLKDNKKMEFKNKK